MGFNVTIDIFDKVEVRHKKLLQKTEEKYKILTENAHQKIKEKGGETLLNCPKCEKRSQAKKYQWAELYYYVAPYSCTGGDYNKHVGIILACPKCGWDIKMYKDDPYNPNHNSEKYYKLRSLVSEFGIKCKDEYSK